MSGVPLLVLLHGGSCFTLKGPDLLFISWSVFVLRRVNVMF